MTLMYQNSDVGYDKNVTVLFEQPFSDPSKGQFRTVMTFMKQIMK